MTEGTKLTDMPALVEQISTEPVPTNPRAVFAYDSSTSIVVPKTLVVDMIAITDLKYCFYNCNSLTSIVFPDGFGKNVINLAGCFSNCTSLIKLVFPDGFGENAVYLSSGKVGCFHNCQAL